MARRMEIIRVYAEIREVSENSAWQWLARQELAGKSLDEIAAIVEGYNGKK